MYDRINLPPGTFDMERDEIPDDPDYQPDLSEWEPLDPAPDDLTETVCPNCDGEAYSCDEQDPVTGHSIMYRCPTCEGTGYIYESR